MNVYAKLFSRITESSLMEEPINVRYTFVMMLAIADPKGYVVGTDVAIARRLNMPLNEFTRCLEVLMSPDPHSNSQEEQGRRVVASDGERGYRVVNYVTYRDMKAEEQRREYMKEYMRKRRSCKTVAGVKSRKQVLAVLTHAEAEANAEAERKDSVMTFPVVGSGANEWAFTIEHCSRLKETFPGVDVEAEARKAREWVISNPTKRKTASGMPSYLMRWMAKVQDRFNGNVNGSHQEPVRGRV